jgi:hypothetical protein
MVIPQWPVGAPALAYRCGGSTGIGPDHPIGPSPVSRLTPPEHRRGTWNAVEVYTRRERAVIRQSTPSIDTRNPYLTRRMRLQSGFSRTGCVQLRFDWSRRIPL